MNERIIKRGEVYYIYNNYSVGSEQRGSRPAVIISNNTNNLFSNTVEICYLTLKKKPPLPTHVKIDIGCSISTVLCEQITTVSLSRVGKYLCTLSEEDMREIEYACLISLGIDIYGKYKSMQESYLKKGGI